MTNKPKKIGRFIQIKNVAFGKNVTVYDFTNLYGCRIGDDSQVGAFVEIQRDAVIGKRVRVQSHTFICSGISIGDDTFVGHSVTFINDRHPSAKAAREKTWKLEKTHVGRGVSIGSGAVIMCGLTIGDRAVIGAGSVVVKNVAAGATVAGNPAKVLKRNR